MPRIRGITLINDSLFCPFWPPIKGVQIPSDGLRHPPLFGQSPKFSLFFVKAPLSGIKMAVSSPSSSDHSSSKFHQLPAPSVPRAFIYQSSRFTRMPLPLLNTVNELLFSGSIDNPCTDGWTASFPSIIR